MDALRVKLFWGETLSDLDKNMEVWLENAGIPCSKYISHNVSKVNESFIATLVYSVKLPNDASEYVRNADGDITVLENTAETEDAETEDVLKEYYSDDEEVRHSGVTFNVKELRASSGLLPKKFCEKCGINSGKYWHVTRDSAFLTFGELKSIASAFDIPVDNLLDVEWQNEE